MSSLFPGKTEAALDYPDFRYAVLAEILSEGAAPPAEPAKSLPPADAVGIAEKLGLTFGEWDISDHSPEGEEVLLLHIME
jgi:hypothetical protein